MNTKIHSNHDAVMRAALKMAIEALSQDEGWFEPEKAIKACKEALATNEDSLLVQPAQEPKCSKNPDAPHGFCRDASHSAGRYVCECEGWEAEQPSQEPVGFSELDLAMFNDNAERYNLIPTHPAPSCSCKDKK